MKLSKKILSIVLSALMVFSMMPITAFAWQTGNLTFVKMENSWDGYDGKYSAYVHNGSNNDFMGIVLKEVNSDGTITVNKGSSFDVTLSCGTWTSNTSPNGVLPNNTLSWHYGNNDTAYTISSVDNSGSGLTNWKAFLGDDTTKQIQSAIEGEFATAATPSDNFRARASEGGKNEAYGVFKFTPESFPQLNTVGEYTVRLAPTLVMNHWEGGLFSKKWQPKYGWGNYQWSIDQGSPDTNRTIAITVKVVCPHNYQADSNSAQAATCTTAGKEADQVCSLCGDRKEGAVIPMLAHTAGDAVRENEQPATCTNAGSYDEVVRCKVCNHEISRTEKTIPATGSHNYYVLVSAKQDATCTATGNEAVYKCATCDLTTGGDEIPMVAHTNGTPVQENVNDSDCTNAGSYDEVVYCTVCNHEISRTQKTIPATGNHSYTVLVSAKQEATCTSTGKEAVYKCATCDATKGGDEIPMVAHTAGDAVRENEQPATCTNAGSYDEVVRCKVCNHEISRTQKTIPATGNHSYTVEKEAEIPASCTKTGKTAVMKCATCDATKGGDEIPMVAHTAGDAVKENEQPATCTNAGSYDEVVRCKVCNHEISRTQKTIPAKGHTPAAPVNENYVLPTSKTEGSYDEVIYCTADDCDAPNKEISREHKTIPMLSDKKPNNSASLTLNEAVDFNFYIDTPYYAKDLPEDAKNNLVYEVGYKDINSSVENNGEVNVVDTVEVKNTENRTLIKVKTAPAQLTEVITITLKVKDAENKVTVIKDYSMKSYCDQVIDYNMKSAAVCKELIKYAATAQEYFDYKEAGMAAVVDATFKSELNDDYNAVKGSVSATSNIQQDTNDEFKITGVTYVALADTTIRFYLDKTNPQLYASTGYTYGDYEISAVTMDGQKGSRTYKAYFAQNAQGKVYIAVPGIESANLDNAFTFTVKNKKSDAKTTVTYSATAFCKYAVEKGTDTLKDLAKAIVLYNVAADKVF